MLLMVLIDGGDLRGQNYLSKILNIALLSVGAKKVGDLTGPSSELEYPKRPACELGSPSATTTLGGTQFFWRHRPKVWG